jgi:hypothetical protein
MFTMQSSQDRTYSSSTMVSLVTHCGSTRVRTKYRTFVNISGVGQAKLRGYPRPGSIVVVDDDGDCYANSIRMQLTRGERRRLQRVVRIAIKSSACAMRRTKLVTARPARRNVATAKQIIQRNRLRAWRQNVAGARRRRRLNRRRLNRRRRRLNRRRRRNVTRSRKRASDRAQFKAYFNASRRRVRIERSWWYCHKITLMSRATHAKAADTLVAHGCLMRIRAHVTAASWWRRAEALGFIMPRQTKAHENRWRKWTGRRSVDGRRS